MNVCDNLADEIIVTVRRGTSSLLNLGIETSVGVVEILGGLAAVQDGILEVEQSVGEIVNEVIGDVGMVSEVVNTVHGSEDVAEVGVSGHWKSFQSVRALHHYYALYLRFCLLRIRIWIQSP